MWPETIQQAIKFTDCKRFILSNVGAGPAQMAGEWFGLLSVVWLHAGAFGMEVASPCAPDISAQSVLPQQ